MSFNIIKEVKFLIKKLNENPDEIFFTIQVNKELLTEKDIKLIKKLISIYNMVIVICRTPKHISIKLLKKVY